MNMTKKININFSSLVGLKAELIRKQAEVNEVKLKTEPIGTIPQLSKKKSKKTAKQDIKRNAEEVVDSEDIAAHKKSKLMLEAKSRLYDRLKKSKNDDKFLVDFKNKEDESDEEFIDEEMCKEYPIEPEDKWIEYQDCFGRTRKCLREDLPHMQKKDDLIKQEILRRNNDNNGEEQNKEQYSNTQEKEPEIEVMRRKWEEQTRKLEDKVNIHYQDVLFDEARTHGVSYYTFSQDEKERAKQQENLVNLRKETEKKQKETKQVKELKEKLEQNRLKAARIRQRIRAGLPAEPTDDELIEEKLIGSTNVTCNIKTEEVNNKSTEDKEKSNEETTNKSINKEFIEEDVTNKALEDEDKIKAFGELLGKSNHWHVMSQEEWVHKCRDQRNKKFAPVYANFIRSGICNGNEVVDRQSVCEDNNKLDNTESNDESKETSEPHIVQEMNIPLPSENVTSAAPNDNTTCASKQDALSRTINADDIMAGLKYLREKFEESYSK